MIHLPALHDSDKFDAYFVIARQLLVLVCTRNYEWEWLHIVISMRFLLQGFSLRRVNERFGVVAFQSRRALVQCHSTQIGKKRCVRQNRFYFEKCWLLFSEPGFFSAGTFVQRLMLA